MQQEITLVLSPKDASDFKFFLPVAASKAGVNLNEIKWHRILRKSIDARQRDIKINLKLLLGVNETKPQFVIKPDYQNVSTKPTVIIVGAGPAGLFAALRLLEIGLKPIIVERGKDVHERKRDIATINRTKTVALESNYCFGEGGAGTFSDGKLYTRSNKRGDVTKILNSFFYHGAPEDILYETHPHIGTDKLPAIIEKMRNTIVEAGGKIFFETRMCDILIKDNKIQGIVTQSSDKIEAGAVILATGHSARDVYELLHGKNILLEAKPFAMGVRVEHPQQLIDSIQYHFRGNRNPFLPAATYNWAEQVDGRGVYSFCMCPGGYIVPASTSPTEIVVNGMSPSKRNSPFANSGIVVEIHSEDLDGFQQYGALAGLKFQHDFETLAFRNGGGGQIAPAQRLTDFLSNKISNSLPENSYQCGTISSPVHFWLPDLIAIKLKQAFKIAGNKMHGYLTPDAVVVGVESRTSTPVKIPRDATTMQHPQIAGLFPCGEGAGYAGGIVSSAMDGENCADKVKTFFENI